MVRVTLAAAIIVACSSLHFAPEEGFPVCGQQRIAYQAVTLANPEVCSVYCLPRNSKCVGLVQAGKFSYLGITEDGNCRRKGYTKQVPLGPVATDVTNYLEKVKGPCQGMTLMGEFMADPHYSAKACEREQIPYESFMSPGICSVYCVPEGDCQGMVQNGDFNNLGITGEGDCKSRGYTKVTPFGDFSSNMEERLERLTGPCRGMKLLKFQKPNARKEAPPVNNATTKPVVPTHVPTAHNKSALRVSHQQFNRTSAVQLCGKEMIPYEGFPSLHPRVCSIFCVPEGLCEGKVQTGYLQNFGIKGVGNCKDRGYTKVAPDSPAMAEVAEALVSLEGPCRGLKLGAQFQEPRR